MSECILWSLPGKSKGKMVKIWENNTCRSTQSSRKLYSVVYFQILQLTVNIKGILTRNNCRNSSLLLSYEQLPKVRVLLEPKIRAYTTRWQHCVWSDRRFGILPYRSFIMFFTNLYHLLDCKMVPDWFWMIYRQVCEIHPCRLGCIYWRFASKFGFPVILMQF